MSSHPALVEEPVRFGEDYALDLLRRRLCRRGHPLKLERIPLEILVLLVERAGEVVTRDQIVARVWGKSVFFDTDNGIRVAIRKLRQALRDHAESPRFIQTVTGQGYRFIARVTVPEEQQLAPAFPFGSAASSIGTPTLNPVPNDSMLWSASDHAPEKRGGQAGPETTQADISQLRWHARRWPFLSALSVLVLGAVTAYFATQRGPADAKHSKITSLAVLPLKNLSGDPAQEYFADGMTEELIGRLSTIRGLRVISRTSSMQFKDTRLLASEIAGRLGVDALVEGSVMREGNRLRVHAQLIRASADEHFWTETYDRELGDALALESEVAESIAEKVQATASGEEHARLVAAHPVSADAYESYLEGLAAREDTRAEIEKRLAYFDEAIRKDPSFAPAYAGLAEAYLSRGTILVGGAPPTEARAKAISNAQKALELDPELADAYVILANTHASQWRWTQAEAEYRRALDLAPNNAAAHEGYSDWLLCHGRVEEALAWARRGRELDPMGTPNFGLVWILYNARRYEEAIQESRTALALQPDNGSALRNYGIVLIFNHQANEAIPVLEKAAAVTNRTPGVIGFLVWAYAHAGRRADALRLLDELKNRQQNGYVPPAALMNAYLGLEDNNEALDWLERAAEEQANALKYVKVFPIFDSLRGNPRFEDLVRRVGLN